MKKNHAKRNEFIFAYCGEYLTYRHPIDKPKPYFRFMFRGNSIEKGEIKCSQRKDDSNVWEFHECIDSANGETVLIGQFNVKDVIVEHDLGLSSSIFDKRDWEYAAWDKLRYEAWSSMAPDQIRNCEERFYLLNHDQRKEEQRRQDIEAWANTAKRKQPDDNINNALKNLCRIFNLTLQYDNYQKWSDQAGPSLAFEYYLEFYLAEIWHKNFERYRDHRQRLDGSTFETNYRKIPFNSLESKGKDKEIQNQKQVTNRENSSEREPETTRTPQSIQYLGKPVPSDHPGIYYITCSKNGSIYVGESIHVRQRWGQHVYNLQNKIHHNFKLQRDHDAFDTPSFKFELIEPIHLTKVTGFFELKVILWAREIWHIRELKSKGHTLYNLTDGGGDSADFQTPIIAKSLADCSDIDSMIKQSLEKAYEASRMPQIDINNVKESTGPLIGPSTLLEGSSNLTPTYFQNINSGLPISPINPRFPSADRKFEKSKVICSQPDRPSRDEKYDIEILEEAALDSESSTSSSNKRNNTTLGPIALITVSIFVLFLLIIFAGEKSGNSELQPTPKNLSPIKAS